MNNFEYYNPVRVIFGAGELNRIGQETKKLGNNVCLVSYKELGVLTSLTERIGQLLETEGITVNTFYEIEPNPEIRTIEKGVLMCREKSVDCIIGIGGGSAMDAAKAIAAGFYYEGDLWNMVNSRHDTQSAIPPVKALPKLMVPTLPATGSEMNLCAVVSNGELKEKSYIWATCLYPETSIIDPELTLSLPAYQTACAAADTISHVLEIYLNGEADSDLQHYFQEGVMCTVMDNIGKVLENPGNLSARSHLQWAATCAINGWASPGDAWTPIHQIGHVLTARHRIAHGASLSILMPAWMQYMYKNRPDQYARFAKRVMHISAEGKTQEQIIQEGIQAFAAFLKRIGTPTTLHESGVSEADFEAICDDVVKVSFGADGMLACNPPVSRADILNILKLAY